MCLTAKNTAAGRHAYNHRTGKLTVGPVPQTRGFLGDLIVGGKNVISELDLDAGLHTLSRHANGQANDGAFIDRRVKHTFLAILALQTCGAAKNAAEISDVLTENNDAWIALQGYIHRAAQGFNHTHSGHLNTPFLGVAAANVRVARRKPR